MPCKGYWPDNTVYEGLFGRLKNGLFYARDSLSSSLMLSILTFTSTTKNVSSYLWVVKFLWNSDKNWT